MPASGAYLGAWLQPGTDLAGAGSFGAEQRAIPMVRATLGRPLDLLHLYVAWARPAPLARLRAVEADGSIPILDWGCPPSASALATGADDARIATEARALRSLGQPVFLRWCWEMNQRAAHPGLGGPDTYVAAWRHLRSRFEAAGASNVAFVWCPALHGRDPSPYYPGDQYVDWIGIDGYDVAGTATFASLFAPFYAAWSGHGKPMMVAETGSPPAAQVAYLTSVGDDLPTMPGFKAFVYFDGAGPSQDWRLTPAGLAAFARLAADPVLRPSG